LKRAILALVMFGMILAVPLELISAETSTRAITGWSSISTGLTQDASFTSVEVWDFDGDGLDEIYLGGAGRSAPKTEGIHAFEYNSGTSQWNVFGSGLPGSSSGEYFGALGLGDLNKDGKMDVVAPKITQWYSQSQTGVKIFTGSGTGSFSLAHTIPIGASANEAEVTDVDNDGNADIVVSAVGGVKVYFGSGSATAWTEASPPGTTGGEEVDGIGVGDLNGDGLADIAATKYFSNNDKVLIYIQTSARTWQEITFKTDPETFGIKIADLDGDGNSDVVYGTRSSGIRVYLGNGGGSTGGTSFSWTEARSGLPTSGGDYSQVELADLDGDGKPELITASNGQSKGRLYHNDLPSGWSEMFSSDSDFLRVGGSAYGANFGDWNGDGTLDTATCSWGGGVDAWLLESDDTPPVNNPPTANAGSDQEVVVGDTVNLDGTASTDAEDAPSGDGGGTILSYDWGFSSVPASSSITEADLGPSDAAAKPSFVPDEAGDYIVTLKVADSKTLWSSEVSITITATPGTPTNLPPVANAGPDQSVYVGDVVTLDGSGSSDSDGTIVQWNWSCTSHTVSFTDPNSAAPSFTPGEAGNFVMTLGVQDDGSLWSVLEDTVNINVVDPSAGNLPPNADAGEDQTVTAGDLVTLDGSGSADPDGTIITWEWTPSNAGTVLSDTNSSGPTFTPGSPGEYGFDLRVMDDHGAWSTPDDVMIVVNPVNQKPIADAGEDQTVNPGATVTLDGSGSSDPDGYIVTWTWSTVYYPGSNLPTLENDDTDEPFFDDAAEGDYRFELTVMDNRGEWSDPDQVDIRVGMAENQQPMADAGEDQTIELGQSVTLDGTGSYDPDGTINDYHWECTSHGISLDEYYQVTAEFTPEEPGIYVFELKVRDNLAESSEADEVTITVTAPGGYGDPITLGPFKYNDGTPVADADVEISGNFFDPFSTTTDQDGLANLGTFRQEGDLNVKVTKDGKTLIDTFKITVDKAGKVTPPTGGYPTADDQGTAEGEAEADGEDDDDDDDDDDDPGSSTGDESDGGSSAMLYALIGVIVVVVVIVLVLFLVMKGKKKHPLDEGEDFGQSPPPPAYPQQAQVYPQQANAYPQQANAYPQQAHAYPQQANAYPQQTQLSPNPHGQQSMSTGCPACGSPMQFNRDFNRNYCPSCRQYR